MMEISLTLLITLLLAWPLGLYMGKVFRMPQRNDPSESPGAHGALDKLFGRFENLIYRLIGVNPEHGTTSAHQCVSQWHGYNCLSDQQVRLLRRAPPASRSCPA